MLSPDGNRYAAVMGTDSASQLQVRSTADNAILSVTAAEKQKLRSLSWVGNDHVVATISATYKGYDPSPREQYGLVALDLAAGRKWRELDGSGVFGVPRGLIRDG